MNQLLAPAAAPAALRPRPRDIPGFERFSRSHHWLAGAGPAGTAPPAMAFVGACARAVVRYWEIGLAAGSVDAAAEVLVLEPDAGSGRFTWMMHAALEEALADSLAAGLQVRYLACSGDRARGERLARHLAHSDGGIHLESVLWRPGEPAPAATDAADAPDFAANPVTVLAHGYFGGLVQDLFRHRRGRLFEGLLAQRPRDEPLCYRWRGIDAAGWLPAPWRALLEGPGGDAPRLFPSGALHSLDRLARLCRDRYLLLAVERDAGVAPPPRHWPANRRLPVDLACLADYQARQGAQAWQGWHGEDGTRVLALLRDAANPARRETLDVVTAGLRDAAPDDHRHLAALLRAAAHALEPARVLAVTRLSGFDPAVLAAGMDALERAPLPWDAAARRDALGVLARVWAHHLPSAGRGDLGPRLARLAAALELWGLAKSVARMEAASRERAGDCLLILARCEAETGETHTALANAQAALAQGGGEPARRLRDRLAARVRAWADLSWYRPEAAVAGELRIEPDAEPPGLRILHESRGLLARADFRVGSGIAHFRLDPVGDGADSACLEALPDLLAHFARGLGAAEFRLYPGPSGARPFPHPHT